MTLICKNDYIRGISPFYFRNIWEESFGAFITCGEHTGGVFGI